jgi:hypothetical protein
LVFTRSIPPVAYNDYTRYRSLLRLDFRYRCAYCLTPEFYVGGEAGCEIEHHRPQKGQSARPDLVHVYENLYWCCRECNQNKGDTWPSPEEFAQGRRFLDPCQPGDDHDLHWETQADGTLRALTPAGEYTIEQLMLWRDFLVFHRARCFRWQEEINNLRELLATRVVSPEQLEMLESRIRELQEWVQPPVFNRVRRTSI